MDKDLVKLIQETIGMRRAYTFSHVYEVAEILLNTFTEVSSNEKVQEEYQN